MADPKALYANYLYGAANGLREAASNLEALANELLARTPAARSAEIKRVAHNSGLKVRDLEFSVRTSNILAAHNIKNLCELAELTAREVRSFRHLGVRSFTEIREVLETTGLSFKKDT